MLKTADVDLYLIKKTKVPCTNKKPYHYCFPDQRKLYEAMIKMAEKNGEGAAPPATPVKPPLNELSAFARKKRCFFNPSRQISTRPQCVLPVLKTGGRVSA